MTTKGKSTQRSSILSDVIHCSHCRASMVVNKARYVCPNNDRALGGDCSTASVDAEKLAHQLIATLVNRVMTPRNLADIVERIQQSAYDNLRTQREKLDNTESAIEDLNSQKRDSLTKVEYGEVPFKKMVDSLEAIEAASTGLAYESAVARGEIDKLEFVSNEQAIRSVAQDIGTYTEFADPELAKELVSTFIEDVRVGPTSYTVTYTHPIPGENNDELITSETFPLP